MSSRKLRISKRARRDLRAIAQYSAKTWGVEQAKAYEKYVYDALQRVSASPNVGRPREDVRPGLRTYRAREHLVLYQSDDVELVVLRVLHGRMDIRSARDEPD